MADLRSVIVSPDGRNVYASASDDDALTIFDRDPANGEISQKVGGAGCIVNAPSADVTDCDNTGRAIQGPGRLAISPDGKNVYLVTESAAAVAIFNRDAVTGALTQKAGAAGCIVNDTSSDIGNCDNTGRGLAGATDVAVSADGKSVYVVAAPVTRWRCSIGTHYRDAHQRAGAEGCIVNGRAPTSRLATTRAGGSTSRVQ